MTMKSYLQKNSNANKRNIKRKAKILYLLSIKGITQKDISKKLNISKQAVNQAIYGKSKITKVEDYLREKIGVCL